MRGFWILPTFNKRIQKKYDKLTLFLSLFLDWFDTASCQNHIVARPRFHSSHVPDLLVYTLNDNEVNRKLEERKYRRYLEGAHNIFLICHQSKRATIESNGRRSRGAVNQRTFSPQVFPVTVTTWSCFTALHSTIHVCVGQLQWAAYIVYSFSTHYLVTRNKRNP